MDVLLSVVCTSSLCLFCECSGAVYKPQKDAWIEKSVRLGGLNTRKFSKF